MLLVARKNLFAERTRLAISVGGVALSVFLIGILLSLYRGWSQQVGGFVEDVPADLWVTSDGTTDFVAAGSVLPDSLSVPLGHLPEVDVVSPLIVRPLESYRSGDKPTDTFDVQLVGYDPEIGLGGPLAIVEGKSPPGPGEVVVDISGGDFIYTQVAFATLDTTIDFLQLEPTTQRTFFVVTLDDPSQRDVLASRLALAAPGVQLVTGEDFARETRDRILSNILPILVVVLIVAFVVGLAVAGLTIYTATVEKSREYGILKAEGFTNPYLYRVVFEQSMVTGILGFLVGAGVTVLLAPFAQDAVPQFVVWVRWQDIAGIAGATLLMALVAAYIPVRRLSHIDPVTVFKG